MSDKTSANVGSWIEDPDQHVIVAEQDGLLVGVGGASGAGKITLNYVAPEARFRGVSKSILASLEAHLRWRGFAHSMLTSTRTALHFYLSAGYEEMGEPETWSSLVGQPMRKVFR